MNAEKTDNFLEFSSEMSSFPDDHMPIQSKGGYNLDFDNLDAMNPFQGSNKTVLSPAKPDVENSPPCQTEPQDIKPGHISEEKIECALDETLPFSQSVENSLADMSDNISSSNSSVVTVMKAVEADSYTATPDEKQCAKMSIKVDDDKESGSSVDDPPLPAKGSYTLDFDNLDAINPFQTGGPKIQNSPVTGIQLSHNNPPTLEVSDDNPPAEKVQSKETNPTEDETQKVAPEVAVQPEMTVAAVAPILANPAIPSTTESQASDVKGGPVKLEFNFSDGNEVGPKPLPKKFGKRPPGLKSTACKPSSDIKPTKETPGNPDNIDVVDVLVPKGSYSFDFDDPNFNPFGAKSSINNSPKCVKNSSPGSAEHIIPKQAEKVVEAEAVSSTRCSKCFVWSLRPSNT